MSCIQLSTSSMLQCGHGGEAVENSLPAGPGVPGLFWLQCGHGGEAVENGRQQSPRPEKPSGFNAATAVKPWRTLRRGEGMGPTDGVLQCGHGGEAVENHRFHPLACMEGFVLQCGHNGEAVENNALAHFQGMPRWASMRPRR